MRAALVPLALASLLAACAPAATTAQPQAIVSLPVSVSITTEPGVDLRATYAVPAAPIPGAPSPVSLALVALHGCGGPWPARDTQWRQRFLEAGFSSVWPDSFGSRGLGSQCGDATRTVTPGRQRRADAVAAVNWLVRQPYTPPGGVAVVGWSNGGSTVLAAAAEGVMPPGTVRGFVAFYPGCRATVNQPAWRPAAPILIVMGEDDDWTPAAPCRTLAARFPDRIRLVTFPGAYHDFDAPNRSVTLRHNLASTANRTGSAHAGTNEPARAAVLRDVPAFLAALPPAQ